MRKAHGVEEFPMVIEIFSKYYQNNEIFSELKTIVPYLHIIFRPIGEVKASEKLELFSRRDIKTACIQIDLYALKAYYRISPDSSRVFLKVR